MMLRSWLVVLLALSLFVSLLGGVVEGSKEEIVAGLGRDPGTAYNYGAHPPLTRVLEPLIFRDLDLGLIPGLARDWEVSSDGLTWTLYLEEGVFFHDGSLFNGEEVAHNLERIQKTWPGRLGPVESIEAVGEWTIELTHTKPFAPFLYILAWPGAAMISSTAIDEEGKVIEPIGTGPFIRESWRPDEEMVLLRNDDYWGGRAHLDRITLKVIPDPTTRMMALEAEEIHMIIDTGGVLPEQVPTLMMNDAIEVLSVAGAVPHYMTFNTNIPPFDRAEVRQAAMRAIDPKSIIDFTLEGQGKVMTSVIPYAEKDWMHPENLYEFNDLEGATQLIEAAGGVEGEGEALFLLASSLVGRWPYQPIAEIVQYQLKELGIEVKIQVVETGLFWDMLGKGEAHISIRPWAGISPYTRLFDWLHSKGSNTLSMGIFYENEKMDALLEDLLHTTDEKRAKELAYEAQELAAQDAPILPIYDEVLINAILKGVKGYTLHPWFTVNWEDIYWE